MLITSKLVIQILVLILANDNADNTNDNNANDTIYNIYTLHVCIYI